MTEQELAEIEARALIADVLHEPTQIKQEPGGGFSATQASVNLAEDVPRLIAEIRRLQSEVERLRLLVPQWPDDD